MAPTHPPARPSPRPIPAPATAPPNPHGPTASLLHGDHGPPPCGARPITKPAKPTLTRLSSRPTRRACDRAGRLRLQCVANSAGPSDPAPRPHLAPPPLAKGTVVPPPPQTTPSLPAPPSRPLAHAHQPFYLRSLSLGPGLSRAPPLPRISSTSNCTVALLSPPSPPWAPSPPDCLHVVGASGHLDHWAASDMENDSLLSRDFFAPTMGGPRAWSSALLRLHPLGVVSSSPVASQMSKCHTPIFTLRPALPRESACPEDPPAW